ncbi:MAG: hypothetical protein KJ886_04185 [Candidatus Thermoplasmatota archaeon]|nr:hypothetical protein [Candidatus Thermoplasmatota archaeon]
MKKRQVTITFIEPKDDKERRQKIIELLADGFYRYLKKTGYFKENIEMQKKVDRIVEETNDLCHGDNPTL